MTQRGTVFVMLFALTLLTALATGAREIYLVVFCLGLILLLSILSAVLGAYFLSCRQSLQSSMAVRGESVRLKIAISGIVCLPVIVELRIQPPGVPDVNAVQPRYIFSLLPFRKSKPLAIELYCPHRGTWETGIRRLHIHDIFGFFALPLLQKNALEPSKLSFTVYPVLYDLDGNPSSPSISLEYTETALITADQGDSFSGTRQYRDGDSLKRIHWKQTIRTQELHTRQYETSTEQYALILLDTGITASASVGVYADIASECACALAMFYTQHSQPIRLLCVGAEDYDLSTFTEDDFSSLYTLLATATFQQQYVPLDFSVLCNRNWGMMRVVHVITNRPTPELFDSLQPFIDRNCRVTCIVPLSYNASAFYPQTQESTIRVIPIVYPQDITAKLGDCL